MSASEEPSSPQEHQVPSPELSAEEELRTYEATRAAALPLMERITRQLSGPAMLEAGRRLGMISRNENDGRPLFVWENEQEVALTNDYAIFSALLGGQNAVARYLAAHPPPPDSLEMTLLQGMLRARYSLFAFIQSVGAVGVDFWGLLRNEYVHVADKGFHSSGQPGMVLALRVIPLPYFAISSGAALPVSPSALADLGRALTPLLGRNLQAGLRKLTSTKEADLVALIIRKLLAEGASEQVRYENP